MLMVFSLPAFVSLPSFGDVPNTEKQSLFIKKLNLCCTQLTSASNKDIREGNKEQTLVELATILLVLNFLRQAYRNHKNGFCKPVQDTDYPSENKVEAFD
jgi:hypothetical protein